LALPGAPEALAEAARAGCRVGYLTNNGSRNAAQVAEHLRALGFDADEREVVTSGQAAARLLAEQLPAGSAVLVVGTDALAGLMTEVGLTITTRAEDAKAVVQGHSPRTAWRDLAEACLAIRAGALWVACNMDATLPDERGELPGNGSMVAALVSATGRRPEVAGKPEAALYREAVRRSEARSAVMVGDRLGTDIAGANAVGLASLLVLTGVSHPAAVLAAPRLERPTYLAADLGALTTQADRLRPIAQHPWRVWRDTDTLVLAAAGTPTATDPTATNPASPRDPENPSSDPLDPIAALRTLCAAHWAEGGGPARTRADDEAAGRALDALGLGAGQPAVDPVG
jgi:HAD superfamily hydrolase (TIGR01450 family)